MVRKFFAIAVLTALAALAASSPAAAAQQSGLVNINVEDNVVQVPVAIAANICDVTVAVLVSDLEDGSATCDALAMSGATVTPRTGGGPPTTQEGLINVNLENNTVQIPIAAAANVCDVDVIVLATEILLSDATSCTARAGAAGIA
jgi:hypothetical protein